MDSETTFDSFFRLYGNENSPEVKEESRHVKRSSAALVNNKKDQQYHTSSAKSPRYQVPGSFDLSNEEIIVHQMSRSASNKGHKKRDLVDNSLLYPLHDHSIAKHPFSPGIMSQRDLNASALIQRLTSEENGNPGSTADLGDGNVLSDFYSGSQQTDQSTIQAQMSALSFELNSLGHSTLKRASSKQLLNSEAHPPSYTLDKRHLAIYKNQVKERFQESDFVKVNIPVWGLPLLPDDAPLDLSPLKETPHLLLFHGNSKESPYDQQQLIDILNFEMMQLDQPKNSRGSFRNGLANLFYSLFNCGEMSIFEIGSLYPWTWLLVDRTDDVTETSENELSNIGIEVTEHGYEMQEMS